MKYVYLVLGLFAITVITIFTFKEDVIYYNYAKYTVKNEKNNNNYYYYEDNFAYIDSYDGIEIHNKEELYESIYYLVNSGISYAERYFNIDYIDFVKDYNELFVDELKINSINNFVHPYNSFDSIETVLDGYLIQITIHYNTEYSNDKKEKIDNEVDKIINKLIKKNMNDKEKIKVIHDHIINNTVYDKNFCIEKDPKNCKTTSPYQSDTAYGVLIEHNGICSGYTDLMAIFLNKLGIVNYRVTNDNHTWNAVKLNNKWYHLDATWDDPISDEDMLVHTYFMITPHEDSLLDESHAYNKEIFIELR